MINPMGGQEMGGLGTKRSEERQTPETTNDFSNRLIGDLRGTIRNEILARANLELRYPERATEIMASTIEQYHLQAFLEGFLSKDTDHRIVPHSIRNGLIMIDTYLEARENEPKKDDVKPPEEMLREICLMAIVHDLGKINPEFIKILSIQGPLDEEQSKVKRAHPIDGAQALFKDPNLQEIRKDRLAITLVTLCTLFHHGFLIPREGGTKEGPGSRAQTPYPIDILNLGNDEKDILKEIKKVLKDRIGEDLDPDLAAILPDLAELLVDPDVRYFLQWFSAVDHLDATTASRAYNKGERKENPRQVAAAMGLDIRAPRNLMGFVTSRFVQKDHAESRF